MEYTRVVGRGLLGECAVDYIVLGQFLKRGKVLKKKKQARAAVQWIIGRWIRRQD